MANELAISIAAAYEDSKGKKDAFDLSNLLLTLTTAQCHHTEQLVTITQVAINLGPVSSLGVLILCNLDPTYSIDVKTATGGTIIARLYPKVTTGATGLSWCAFQVGSGISAPFVISNGVSPGSWMEIFLLAV